MSEFVMAVTIVLAKRRHRGMANMDTVVGRPQSKVDCEERAMRAICGRSGYTPFQGEILGLSTENKDAVCGAFDAAVDLKFGAVDPAYPADGHLGFYNTPSPLYATFSGKLGTIFSAVLNVWCVLFAVIKSW